MNYTQLSNDDSEFLTYLRSISIFVIVFIHVGGYTVFKPYSVFLNAFVPIFFFMSGAVNFHSFKRSNSVLSYYQKRFTGLLVPYYLYCGLALLVYIAINKHFPALNLRHLWLWIQIRPALELMPFSVSQVWFLNVLFFITLFSPVYFYLYEKSVNIIYIFFIFFLLLSGWQLFYDINDYFNFLGNDLFRPLVSSSFFMFGMIYFSSANLRGNSKLFLGSVLFLGVSVFLAYYLNLSLESFNRPEPTLYFVSGSFVAILWFLLLQRQLLTAIKKSASIESMARFFHKHTFSIFLLHSFGIFIAEEVFGLINPPHKNIAYGIKKLIVTLAITGILVVPFTAISSFLTNIISGTFQHALPKKSCA